MLLRIAPELSPSEGRVSAFPSWAIRAGLLHSCVPQGERFGKATRRWSQGGSEAAITEDVPSGEKQTNYNTATALPRSSQLQTAQKLSCDYARHH